MRKEHNILVDKPEGNISLRRPRYRWIVHKCMLMRWGVRLWTGLIWLMTGRISFCDVGNAHSCSIKADKFLTS
jgi:hypothetical protein